MQTALAFLILAAVDDAVVRCQTSHAMYSGTVISRDLVLTAKHCTVGRESDAVEVRFKSGKTLRGRFHSQAKSAEGAALIKIPAGDYPQATIATALPKAKSVSVRCLGYPGGTYQLKERRGHLRPGSGKLTGNGSPTHVNELDIPILQGYSGGPVLNPNGEIIGVISSTDDRSSLHVTLADIASVVKPAGIRPAQFSEIEKPNSATATEQPEQISQAPSVDIGAGVRVGPQGVGIGAGIGLNRRPHVDPPLPWAGLPPDDRPWLVVYGSNSCGPCSALWKDIESSAGEPIRKNYRVFYVNIDKYPCHWRQICRKHQHDGTKPFLVDQDGRKHTGYCGHLEEILKAFPWEEEEVPITPVAPKIDPAPVPSGNARDATADSSVIISRIESLEGKVDAWRRQPSKDGSPGIDGRNGKDGEPGAKGDRGEAGPRGPNGLQGLQGPAGKDGKPGKDGANGRDGERGPQGERGPAGDGTEIDYEKLAEEVLKRMPPLPAYFSIDPLPTKRK